LDPQELESKFNSKTKAIILNMPHNPIGKVSLLSPFQSLLSTVFSHVEE
jgi:kynurenine--oxoglutarate transaminase/cysteine-S-conjugate beta-lyase/glutamine--phenylpyruvate transaminase